MKKLTFYILILLFSSPPLLYGSGPGRELVLTKEHWAYHYMEQLSDAGLLRDYPAAYIREYQKELTRYELANYLKDLIEEFKASRQNISYSQEFILNRLMVELKIELSDLGVTITYLQPLSPAPPEKYSIYGEGEGEEYKDLDCLLGLSCRSEMEAEKVFPEEENESTPEIPYYYFGSYDTIGNLHDYFLFIPGDFLRQKEAPEEKWEVIYQINQGKCDTFLLVEGGLPLKDDSSLDGYFLFPLTLEDSYTEDDFTEVEESAVHLLTSLYETYQINGLQQIQGTLPLSGFSQMDAHMGYGLTNGLKTGMQIGDFIVSTGFGLESKGFPLQKWTWQTGAVKPELSLNASYLLNNPTEDEMSFKGLNLGLLGSLPLSESTEIYGGFSWGYDQDLNYLRKMSVVNSLTNAGVSFKVNDYLSLLADFSYYNDFSENNDDGAFTSLGLEWGEKSRLILGLQMFSLEEPQWVGEFSLQF